MWAKQQHYLACPWVNRWKTTLNFWLQSAGLRQAFSDFSWTSLRRSGVRQLVWRHQTFTSFQPAYPSFQENDVRQILHTTAAAVGLSADWYHKVASNLWSYSKRQTVRSFAVDTKPYEHVEL